MNKKPKHIITTKENKKQIKLKERTNQYNN